MVRKKILIFCAILKGVQNPKTAAAQTGGIQTDQIYMKIGLWWKEKRPGDSKDLESQK